MRPCQVLTPCSASSPGPEQCAVGSAVVFGGRWPRVHYLPERVCEYTLGIHNNDLNAKPFQITSHCGEMLSVTELNIDQSEKAQRGYWPTGYADNDGGVSDEHVVAGGDIRLFNVRVEEKDLACLPAIEPPAPPKGVLLTLRPAQSIQEEILARPTFFQHFDGVNFDWEYLRIRDAAQSARSAWLRRQRVRITVDFSHGLNFYRGLTLLDTFAPRYEKSSDAINDVLGKMSIFGAKDAIIALQKPENNCDDARAGQRFIAGVRSLCERAAQREITLYLQHHPYRSRGSVAKMDLSKRWPGLTCGSL